MSAYEQLFGATLLSKDGEVPASQLDGKYVGVYFSAHWCGPCRQFTPSLRKIYLKLKKENAPFEIVFCSADTDGPSFKEYFGSMPWLAIPFEKEDVKKSLRELFAVSGIPRFVMLNSEGVINPSAKEDVLASPDSFPWKQPTVKELIGASIMKGKDVVGEKAIEGKYFGLYFSAHWCNPCKIFTPKLVTAYTALVAQGKPFEVVFCSSDNNPTEYEEYYATMPWCTLGYQSPIKAKLASQLGVEGIPTFIMFDPEGNIINGEGRAAVTELGAEGFPWAPAAIKDLNQEPDDINACACFVLFNEGGDAALVEAATRVAASFAGKGLSFFFASENGDVSEQIRGMTKITEKPTMVIVNIPDNGGFYLPPAGDVTEEAITAFVQAYLDGSVERQQMVA